MPLFSLDALNAAQQLVHRHMPPTPQYAWPLKGMGIDLHVLCDFEGD